MAFVNLTKTHSNPTNGKDQIVIRKRLSFIDGGKSLDVTGVTEEALYAGHVIVKVTETGEYKPLGVSGENFAALGAGEEFVGVLGSSIMTDTAFATILTAGVVGELAMPYKLPTAVKTAFKAAIPALQLH